MFARILCLFGFHKTDRREKNWDMAAGCRCARPGCDFVIEPIKWPREPKQAK
ncbi:MAG: hypothetical protein V1867_05405 [Candidatus Falkowbacteria bacterium]